MPDHQDFGWEPRPAEVEAILSQLARPTFAEAAPRLSGSGTGKTILLYKAFKDVFGRYPRYAAQIIGCCVSRGYEHGVDLRQCIQISIGKSGERLVFTSHEAIYGMARVDIGGGRIRGDGAVGAWAAKAVSTLGTVSAEQVAKYAPHADATDAGPYSDALAKDWGDNGVPAEIKRLAAEHKTAPPALVRTYEELEDALANGYPVPVCSNQGFTLTRDEQGFCRPKGTWGHCMLICGCRADERPGACIFQSWGPDNPSGPLALDQPTNSFWADRETVASMLAMQDSFALPIFDGYPGQTLPEHWTASGWA